jgi:hypothetical protein
MFYLFFVDILILGYVGANPPEGFLVPLGQIATFFYFIPFFALPYISIKEEKWLRKKGLPDTLVAMMDSDKAQSEERRGHTTDRRNKDGAE